MFYCELQYIGIISNNTCNVYTNGIWESIILDFHTEEYHLYGPSPYTFTSDFNGSTSNGCRFA